MGWAINVLWDNVREFTAIKGSWNNIKTLGLFHWFCNELSPAGYTNPNRWPTLFNYLREAWGWVPHVAIGYFIRHKLGGPLWSVAAFGIFLEVVEFIASEGAYINPINSTLDVWFYVLGGLL